MSAPYDQQENPQAWTAWECLSRTAANIFLTGKAGTGKTTFLRHLRQSGLKQMVVAAPTGVAAINAGGVTLHSFFQLPFGITLPGQGLSHERKFRKEKLSLIRTMDLLVIDEVSMVRADLLDAIDTRLREIRRSELPFGGVQLLLIGDLMQLSPVVTDEEAPLLRDYYATNYFFGSQALQRTTFFTIELRKIYRQTDPRFISLLNKVRNNALDDEALRMLDSRYNPRFNPPDGQQYIRLTTHNTQAEAVNNLKLAQIDGKLHTYHCSVKGTFPEKSYPADGSLGLKIGAQVMFLRNDKEAEKRYYNGKIGRVLAVEPGRVIVTCDDEFGSISVEPEEWNNVSYETDAETGEIKQKVDGTFSQIPLCLAWAITIHKSQGLTFDHAIIDAGNSFSAGQVYVALSRCRTFEGLTLSSPITRGSVKTDPSVLTFMAEQENRFPDEASLDALAADFAMRTLMELFDFRSITIAAHKIKRLLEENYHTTYPKIIASLAARLDKTATEIAATAQKFILLCQQRTSEGACVLTDATLRARVQNGSAYFEQKATELLDGIRTETAISLENKALAKQLTDWRATFAERLEVKHAELRAVAAEGFSPEAVMRARGRATAQEAKEERKERAAQKAEKNQAKVTAEMAEVDNKELYADLSEWRAQRAAEMGGLPAYTVAKNLVLIYLANCMPRDKKELMRIPGMGDKKVKAYGDEILAIIARHAARGTKPSLPLDSPEASAPKDPAPKDQAPKDQAEPKKKSAEVSLELYRKLGSIDKVAEARALAVSTVTSHLLEGLPDNGLTPVAFMGEGRYNTLCRLMAGREEQPLEKLADLRDAGYTYTELKVVKVMHAKGKSVR